MDGCVERALRGTCGIAPVEHAMHLRSCMVLTLDREQSQVLREMLQGAVTQLRLESARADSHDFREILHRREGIVTAVLAQLSEPRAA
jgi:hypothetical protein